VGPVADALGCRQADGHLTEALRGSDLILDEFVFHARLFRILPVSDP